MARVFRDRTWLRYRPFSFCNGNTISVTSNLTKVQAAETFLELRPRIKLKLCISTKCYPRPTTSELIFSHNRGAGWKKDLQHVKTLVKWSCTLKPSLLLIREVSRTKFHEIIMTWNYKSNFPFCWYCIGGKKRKNYVENLLS